METKNVTIDKTVLENLRKAGQLAIDVKAEGEYVPEYYRDKKSKIPREYWPVFKIRGLDGITQLTAEDEMDSTVDPETRRVDVKTGKYRIRVCALGVLGWKNLIDYNGNSIPSPEAGIGGGVGEDGLRVLSPSIISELCRAITERSFMKPEELLSLG